MVKIILIARKIDGMILSEYSEEASENENLFKLTRKTKEMLTKFSDKRGDCSLNIDSDEFMIQ